MSHALRCLPKEKHPLLDYARARSAAEATKAMRAAEALKCVDAADFSFSAAKEARDGKLLDQLPLSDIFAQNVRALLALHTAAAGITEAKLKRFGEWPAPLREAYHRLTEAQSSRIDTARMLVTRAEPGYKHYVGALTLEADESVPTACVNHDFLVRYNPGFLAFLGFGQLLFVLLHEAEHITHRHIPRSFPILPAFRERDAAAHAKLTNIAADLEILGRQNRAAKEDRDAGTSFAQKFAADIPGTLSSENLDKQDGYIFPEAWLISENQKIPGGARIPLADNFFEAIASELFEKLAPTTEQEKRDWRARSEGQRGKGGSPGDQDSPGDFQPAPDADTASAHAAREAALRNATRVELDKRNRQGVNGRGTGVGEDEVVEVPRRPTPLSHFISQVAGLSHALRGTHPSWAKPDRYSHVTGVFRPARIRVKEPILFAFDTSGSIGDDELAFALNCLRNYQLLNLYSEVYIALWHESVYHWQSLRSPLDLSQVLIQRGGTTMSSVAEHLRRNPALARPAISVFVTDGCVEEKPAVPSARNIVLCTRPENIAKFDRIPACQGLWADIRA